LENASVSAADKEVIARQLGRTPKSIKAISRRCDKGFPQVVFTFPLLPGKTPFPTTYWLTCPFLNEKIAMLESKGIIKDLQAEIEENDGLRDEVMRAHWAYRDERNRLFSPVCGFPDNARKAMDEVGIGGVHDFSKVKCLHAHYAHYLAKGINPIGERIAVLLGDTICDRECEDY